MHLGITYALIKLSVTSTGHGRVVTPIHFGNVVAFYVGYLVHG